MRYSRGSAIRSAGKAGCRAGNPCSSSQTGGFAKGGAFHAVSEDRVTTAGSYRRHSSLLRGRGSRARSTRWASPRPRLGLGDRTPIRWLDVPGVSGHARHICPSGRGFLWWLLQFPHARGPREKIYRVARSSIAARTRARIKPEIPLATHYVHGLAVSNVLHRFMSPESSPVRNHRTRWAEEP